MPYAILTTDKPDHLHVRNENRPVELEYLVANQHRLLAAGALIEDDGSGQSLAQGLFQLREADLVLR